MSVIIGIDASNILSGGGVTHLVEILRHLEPSRHDIERVVVWGPEETLKKVESRNWLKLRNPSACNGSLWQRLYWQQFRLASEAKGLCDILFIPGGIYLGNFRPFVTMMRNMSPFDREELARYELSWDRLRNDLLRWAQRKTFEKASGLIFLTETSRAELGRTEGKVNGKTCIIPHGVSGEFRREPRDATCLSDFTRENPFRWLYVSSVRLYKYQWNVVQALGQLREQGYPVELDLAGRGTPTAMKKLRSAIAEVDTDKECVRYHGHIPYHEVQDLYKQADAFVFASTCETFGQVLVEAMRAGLPIACSGESTAPEIVGDAGVYFDPTAPSEIADAMRTLMDDEELRMEKAWMGYNRSKRYSWGRCARETFSFITDINNSKNSTGLS